MPLKDKDIEKFKKELEALRIQLTQSVIEVNEEVKEIDASKEYSPRQADEGTDDFDKTINFEVSHTEMEMIKQIDRALEKIEEGTYGICDLSGKDIPKARLEALPYASLTVESQEKMEKGIT